MEYATLVVIDTIYDLRCYSAQLECVKIGLLGYISVAVFMQNHVYSSYIINSLYSKKNLHYKTQSWNLAV